MCFLLLLILYFYRAVLVAISKPTHFQDKIHSGSNAEWTVHIKSVERSSSSSRRQTIEHKTQTELIIR